jgi:hypothetical protein
VTGIDDERTYSVVCRTTARRLATRTQNEATDFITDIALFSLPLDAPFGVLPGNDETVSSLRTICEAVAKAACRILQIES